MNYEVGETYHFVDISSLLKRCLHGECLDEEWCIESGVLLNTIYTSEKYEDECNEVFNINGTIFNRIFDIAVAHKNPFVKWGITLNSSEPMMDIRWVVFTLVSYRDKLKLSHFPDKGVYIRNITKALESLCFALKNKGYDIIYPTDITGKQVNHIKIH